MAQPSWDCESLFLDLEVDQLLDIFTHTLGGALRAKIARASQLMTEL